MRCPECGRDFDIGTKCPADGADLIDAYAGDDTDQPAWDETTARSAPAAAASDSGDTVLALDRPTSDTRVGTTLDGRFRVDARIGAGGIGAVYRARQLNVPRDVAIKFLHPELAMDPNLVARFRREAEIVSRLRHPNTVRLFDFGTAPDGALYIVTELLHGRSLEEVIAASPLGQRRVLAILRQVALALEEAHGAGIIHRDLKPGNVFIEQVGNQEIAKILDFGLAKQTTAQVSRDDPARTATGNVVGTPYYMSPEQACGQTLDARSDLYSLGVIAYYSLSGSLPFTGSAAAVLTKHVFEAPRDLRLHPASGSLDREVYMVVGRLLDKSLDTRYGSARELLTDVDRIEARMAVADTGPHAAQPAHPPEDETERDIARTSTAARTSRSRRSLRLGLFIAACIVVAAIVAAVALHTREDPTFTTLEESPPESQRQ